MIKRQGYVYVLHFDRPLAHAQHYIGCTCSPKQRLITHAQGRGARIVQAALEEGIGFRLAALGTCPLATMYRLERQLKDWHGASWQCECCARANDYEAKAIPGTIPYCLDAIAWPLHSDELKRLQPVKQSLTFRFGTDQDTLALSRQIQVLMQANKHALGFIPAGEEGGITQSIAQGRVALAYLDCELAGYAYFTETPECVRIHQVCVTDVERGSGIGRGLVEWIRRSRPGVLHRAAVRDELAANGFWQAIGFRLTEKDTHGTSGACLNVYTHTNTENASEVQ